MVTKAKDLTVALDNILDETPFKQMPEKSPESGPSMSDRLNAAADLLLDQLQPSIRDFAKELASLQLSIPVWQLVIGAVLAQYESGTLSAPSIDAGWQYEAPSLDPHKCEVCGEMFFPTKFGQRFCSQECGLRWDKEFGRGAKKKG